MTESSKSKLWWFVGLFFRLLLVSFLSLILSFVSLGTFMGLGFNNRISWGLIVISNVAVFAWAIYFRFPFFLSRTNRQRFWISAVIAVPIVFLAYYCVIGLLTAALDFASTSDKRTESVTLPSGEVLVNHTFREGPSLGGSGERMNKLFLNNPMKGTSELVGDLNYEGEPNTPSLLAESPHPREFIYGDKKVLVVGSYLCERLKFNNVPYWNITSIAVDTETEAYLKSFHPTNESPNDIGWMIGNVPFLFDSLDLTNNILILKKQIPKGFDNWQQFQDAKKLFPFSLWDEFPPYLVYSANDFKGGSIYQFPLKFDIARTKAKNGPLWDKP
jgi:hypothetical protein